MATEQDLQTKVIKYLESIGAYVIKTITTSKSGVADLIVCHKGKFIAIELKAPGGTIAPLQRYHRDLVIAAGGQSYILDNLPAVKAIFEQPEI